MPVPEEAIVPNAMEAGREDVEEKAPDEFGRGKRHGFRARRAPFAIVLVGEATCPSSMAMIAILEMATRWVYCPT